MKTKTTIYYDVFETVEELDLPKGEDEHILKDEIIQLTSPKAIKTGISSHKLRLCSC